MNQQSEINKNKFLFCAKMMEEGNILPDFKKQESSSNISNNSTKN